MDRWMDCWMYRRTEAWKIMLLSHNLIMRGSDVASGIGGDSVTDKWTDARMDRQMHRKIMLLLHTLP